MLRKKMFYWQREVVQSIKCRVANNCGTHGLVKKYLFLNEGFRFLRINLLQLKVGLFPPSSFQCDIKLINQFIYNPFYSSLPGMPIIVEGAVYWMCAYIIWLEHISASTAGCFISRLCARLLLCRAASELTRSFQHTDVTESPSTDRSHSLVTWAIKQLSKPVSVPLPTLFLSLGPALIIYSFCKQSSSVTGR